MDDATRLIVAVRAGHRCEYCRLHEEDDVFTFHVEHIIAAKHGGTEATTNLAYACQHCNLHKGPNLSGIDPDSGSIVTLFHPRRDNWDEHFALHDYRFVGLTPVGRATIRVLAMNDPERIRIRWMLRFRAE